METALAAAKLGTVEQLEAALQAHAPALNARDAEGRTPLHWAAGFGHDRCVDLLLAQPGVEPAPIDTEGDSPLHFSAVHGQPMVAYTLATKQPAMCLVANTRGNTPVDAAVACEQGEVLNAMLLACAGDGSDSAVAAMRALLEAGAVADTWAPNGSSALMLAASVDCVAAVDVLLKKGATLELQDALGRSALMFAAGNDSRSALAALLGAGASIAARDRRGRSVLEYAAEHAAAHSLLQDRLSELEARAAEHRAALLADLEAEATAPAKPKPSKKGKKAGKRVRKGPGAAAGQPDRQTGDDDELEEEALRAPERPGSLAQVPAEQAAPSGSPARPASPAPAEHAPASAPTAAPPGAAAAPAAPLRAGEPGDGGWQVAGKAARKAAPKQAQAPAASAGASATPSTGLPSGVVAANGRSASPPTPPPGSGTYKRCSSLASLSDCSAESRDTDASMATSAGRRSLDALAGAARASGTLRRQPPGAAPPPVPPGRAAVAPIVRPAASAVPPRQLAAASPGSERPLSAAAPAASGGSAAAQPTTWAAKVAGPCAPAAAPATTAPAAAPTPQSAARAEARDATVPAGRHHSGGPALGPSSALALARGSAELQVPSAERRGGAALVPVGEEERLRLLVAELVGALEAERADRVRERAAAEGERRQLAALLQEAAQREALAVAAAVQRERLSFTAQLLAVAAAAPNAPHAKRPPQLGEPMRKPLKAAFPPPGPPGVRRALRGGLTAAFAGPAGVSGAHGSAAFGNVATPGRPMLRSDSCSGFLSGSFPQPPPPPPPPPRVLPLPRAAAVPAGLLGSSWRPDSACSGTVDPPALGPAPAKGAGRCAAPLNLAPGSPPVLSALAESAGARLQRADTAPEPGAAGADLLQSVPAAEGAGAQSPPAFTLFGGKGAFGSAGSGFSLFGGERGRLFQPLVQ